MKKIILCYFLPFSLLKELKTSPYMNVLINISKKFESIFLVNTENLISTKIKTKKFYRIHKNFININPKNYTDLNNLNIRVPMNDDQLKFKDVAEKVNMEIVDRNSIVPAVANRNQEFSGG